MRSLAAALAALVLVAAGCGGQSKNSNKTAPLNGKPFVPKPGDIKLPALPRRGLVVDRPGGAELIGLDGRRHGFLRGMKLRYLGFRSFAADPNRPSLDFTKAGKNKLRRFYMLDAGVGYLIQTSLNRHELGGGFVYRRRRDRIALELQAEIVQNGKRILRLGDWSSSFLRTSTESTILTVKSANDSTFRMIDLRTGSIERLPNGCIVYGIRGGVPNALCSDTEQSGSTTLSLRSRQEGKWKPVYSWLHDEGHWYGGVLSPDERHVVAVRGVPCDTDLVEIVDAEGPRRKQFGQGEPLGWSSDGKAIVFLWDPAKCNRGGSCGDVTRADTGAVYAIDPDTFTRKLIVRPTAAAMWNKLLPPQAP